MGDYASVGGSTYGGKSVSSGQFCGERKSTLKIECFFFKKKQQCERPHVKVTESKTSRAPDLWELEFNEEHRPLTYI